MHPVPEPYRIKSCEKIRLTSREERSAALKAAGYNVFFLPSSSVYVDLLSDSGTSAMSSSQWSRLMAGDESFAHSRSYYSFLDSVRSVFDFEYILPLHQGRIGEHLFFQLILQKGDHVPSNTHFGTTRANIEAFGGIPHDLLTSEAYDWKSSTPFKGNIDIDGLRSLVASVGKERIPVCMVTITNNTGAGQAVSLSNMQSARDELTSLGIPFYVDAARFAENAYLIKKHGERKDSSLADIVGAILSCFDGCLVSAKKDGLSNIGGFFGTNNGDLAERFRDLAMLAEGFYTQGGCAARDLEAMASGIEECLDEEYISFRVRQVSYLGEMLESEGVPVYKPFGGHAVFIIAEEFLSHLKRDDFPGHSLCCEIYLEGGVRTAPENVKAWKEKENRMPEFVRLSIPRRVYSNSHLEYVAEVVSSVYRRRGSIRGLRRAKEPPRLKEFTSTFERR
ncbi:MAG: tryptophanase [bacterium]